MFARVGIQARLNLQTKSKYFDKILKTSDFNTSLFLLGWAPVTQDALGVFLPVMTLKAAGGGAWNAGRYTNPKLEELVQWARVEMNVEKRRALISEIQRIHKEDIGQVPLHEQVIIWGLRDGVEVQPDPRDYVILRFVNVRH
jgi:peptide/nickel transport system substrate-binding protein